MEKKQSLQIISGIRIQNFFTASIIFVHLLKKVKQNKKISEVFSQG